MGPRIEIDRELMDRAMRLSGRSTKRATVEAALREFIEQRIPEPKEPANDHDEVGLRGIEFVEDMATIRPGWEPASAYREPS